MSAPSAAALVRLAEGVAVFAAVGSAVEDLAGVRVEVAAVLAGVRRDVALDGVRVAVVAAEDAGSLRARAVDVVAAVRVREGVTGGAVAVLVRVEVSLAGVAVRREREGVAVVVVDVCVREEARRDGVATERAGVVVRAVFFERRAESFDSRVAAVRLT